MHYIESLYNYYPVDCNVNIDLLLTSKDKAGLPEAGLICDSFFSEMVVAVFIVTEENQMVIAMDDHQHLDLNVSISDEFLEEMQFVSEINLGVILNGVITESHQIPLRAISSDDSFFSIENLPMRSSSVSHFESFIKNCIKGQPAHREDLGNEDSLSSVMEETMMMAPQFSPELVHQRRMEMAPRSPVLARAPSMGPGGGASGASSAGTYRRTPAANRGDYFETDED